LKTQEKYDILIKKQAAKLQYFFQYAKGNFKKMNKSQLIDAVVAKGGLKKKDAEAAVNAVTATIAEALKNGEKVQLVGFGTFEVKERSARTGRNPKTGETIEVPASKHPAFSASKALKDQLN
jgi:DNA-binding protein HU-beta